MSQLTTLPAAPPPWVVALKSPVAPKVRVAGIADPPGYPAQAIAAGPSAGSNKRKDAKAVASASAAGGSVSKPKRPPTPEEMDTLKVKKAWEVALGPIKGLPMTAIMMYMSGNSLQIFSVMMVYMAFKNPIAGLLSTGQAFERFETPSNKAKMLQVKLAFVVMQFVALALGIYKVNAMGLLPTTRSDWLQWEAPVTPLETAVPAL